MNEPLHEIGAGLSNGAHQVELSPCQRAPARQSAPPLLLLDHVSKWYGPVLGVNQVTLEIRAGITGLVGANGAGKTTLLRLATGHLRPDLGTVQILGIHAWRAEAKQYVGYCPEADSFYEDMTGRQFVETMARLSGLGRRQARLRTAAVLESVGMASRADRRLRAFSKGMRQRTKLAQALIHDPALLVLDEPLAGIDPIGRQEFITLFRDLAGQGKGLLISSHELEELEKLTSHVAVMARGRIAAVGSLTQIRELLDDYPLAIMVSSSRARQLAGALLDLPDVVGVELGEADTIVVRARNPRRFFRDLSSMVTQGNYEVLHLETLDDSAQAILGYLLGGGRRTG